MIHCKIGWVWGVGGDNVKTVTYVKVDSSFFHNNNKIKMILKLPPPLLPPILVGSSA